MINRERERERESESESECVRKRERERERERGVRRFSANSINPVTADPRRGNEHLWPCTFSSSDTQPTRILSIHMFAIIRNYSRIKAKTCQTL